MTPKEYYNTLNFVALSKLLNQHPKEKITKLLSTFRCTQNPDLEEFLITPSKAIQFEQRDITRTYLYLGTHNNTLYVVAYFTITLRVLYSEGLSKSVVKKLDGMDRNREVIPSYLIAQLGKSSICEYKIGEFLLLDAINTIKEAHEIVGGRFIILDAVNIPKVIEFYQSEPNAFILLDKDSKEDNVKMYYPLAKNI